jgi:hypothetical protein
MSLVSAEVTSFKAYGINGILTSLTKLKCLNKQLQVFSSRI